MIFKALPLLLAVALLPAKKPLERFRELPPVPVIKDMACGVVSSALIVSTPVERSDGRKFVEFTICFRDAPESKSQWMEWFK